MTTALGKGSGKDDENGRHKKRQQFLLIHASLAYALTVIMLAPGCGEVLGHCHKAELGQAIRLLGRALLAEQLDVPRTGLEVEILSDGKVRATREADDTSS